MRDDLPVSDLRLDGPRVSLRPIREADRPRLRSILAEPGVARWWGTESPDEAAAELYDPGQSAFAIELGEQMVGSIQVSEEETPDYRHASIDIFVGDAHQGEGIGPEAIRLLARYLFDVRGHHRLTIDPAAANSRAIRAYERVGFRRVGVMRAYERGADGTWHDGLLMDLLAAELT